MSEWGSIDGLFHREEQRLEREETKRHAERLAIIAEEAIKSRPKHFVDVYQEVRSARRRWRVECCCGWRQVVQDEAEGWEVASWHI